MTNTLAAIAFDPEMPVDALIADALQDPDLRGRRIVGFLQGHEPGTDCACSDIILTSVHDGTRRKITQNLGSGSTGCRLDSAALAEVAGWTEAILSPRPDLVIVNRFGKIEADGGGFRSVLERAIGDDIPVLLAVGRKHWGVWQDYSAGLALDLPCAAAPIRNYIRMACGLMAQDAA